MGQLIFLCIGLVAGVCSGLFGIGGGAIIVPALVFIVGMQQQQANATSLVALLLPVGILALWKYHKSGFMNVTHVKGGLLIALGLFFGALVGATLATKMDPTLLRKSFAVFLIVIALRMFFIRS
ncbi:MAG: sulfite exporter TauE/SafE family protein [Proteobacteria bacterium]|nr:sulfite exporter TauE/SafE family protein [Pseudomonadota bacterium]